MVKLWISHVFAGAQFGGFGGPVPSAASRRRAYTHLHGLIELHGTEHTHDGSVEGRAGGRSHFVKRDFASDGCCRKLGTAGSLSLATGIPVLPVVAGHGR
jgi:hypothetical protein